MKHTKTTTPTPKMTLTWVSADGSALHSALLNPSDYETLRSADAAKIGYYSPVLDAINQNLFAAETPIKELHLLDDGLPIWIVKPSTTSRFTVDIEGHGPKHRAFYTSSYLVDMEQRDKVAEIFASSGVASVVNLHANLNDGEITRSIARYKDKPVTFVIDESDSTRTERSEFLARWTALGGQAISNAA
jgi:hypothetical protein